MDEAVALYNAGSKIPIGGAVVHVLATSDSPIGPFKKQSNPLFTSKDSSLATEDPFI